MSPQFIKKKHIIYDHCEICGNAMEYPAMVWIGLSVFGYLFRYTEHNFITEPILLWKGFVCDCTARGYFHLCMKCSYLERQEEDIK